MFRFLEISLHGWDLWPPVRLPLDRDVVMLTGPNGSGKTTLLDAIRQLLNAPRLSSRRRLQNYLRRPDSPALIRAVVSNEASAGAHAPFRRERITTPEATLACALVPAGGGAPEKRFAVLPGRASIEEIRRNLLDSRDWYGPERYQRVLENAGVTRSLMSVLAIEQGRTNALFELKPRELFRRVLEMMGDHTVLERYTEARRRFAESEQEVVRQTSSLQKLVADLRGVERQVALLDQWEQQRDRVAELEARLPAAELQVHLRRRAEASAKLPELRTKVRRGETERAALEADSARAREVDARTEAALDTAHREEAKAREAWEGAHGRQVRAADRLEALEERLREAEALPPSDLARLEERAEEAARAVFAAEGAEATGRAHEAAAGESLDRLRAGRPGHPEEVARTLSELKDRQIEATLIAEREPGSGRFALLTVQEQEEAALELVRRRRFPGPLYVAAPLEGPRALGPAVLARAERELEAARQSARAAGETRTAAAARRAAADSGLATERRRQELLRETATLPDAREEAVAAGRALAEAVARRDLATEARETARRERDAAFQERVEAGLRLDQQAARLRGEREALERTEADFAAADARVKELAARVAPDLQARAERGELDGPDTVSADLDRARRSFTLLGEPPPREVREEALHLRANIDEAERHLEARRKEAVEARDELAECRRRYLEIISGSLRDYRRRATELAAGAEVGVEMELPRLQDDDRVLDEAAIQVSFGFDGKEPLPLGDPSFSGGQQVIAGLILLMAMAETDGRGFFMLDEPFAHLSLDRVDQVGRFLRAARSQFILTAPTTLDRAQLDPASLVIVLQKKRPHEPHAPVPIVAEA